MSSRWVFALCTVIAVYGANASLTGVVNYTVAQGDTLNLNFNTNKTTTVIMGGSANGGFAEDTPCELQGHLGTAPEQPIARNTITGFTFSPSRAVCPSVSPSFSLPCCRRYSHEGHALHSAPSFHPSLHPRNISVTRCKTATTCKQERCGVSSRCIMDTFGVHDEAVMKQFRNNTQGALAVYMFDTENGSMNGTGGAYLANACIFRINLYIERAEDAPLQDSQFYFGEQ